MARRDFGAGQAAARPIESATRASRRALSIARVPTPPPELWGRERRRDRSVMGHGCGGDRQADRLGALRPRGLGGPTAAGSWVLSRTIAEAMGAQTPELPTTSRPLPSLTGCAGKDQLRDAVQQFVFRKHILKMYRPSKSRIRHTNKYLVPGERCPWTKFNRFDNYW